MRCVDCGKGLGALCATCTQVAESLGHTVAERLTILGHPPLNLETEGAP